jgi:hypothetical protein
MPALSLRQTHQEAIDILDLLRPEEGEEPHARQAITIIEEHLDQIVIGWEEVRDGLQEKMIRAEKENTVLERRLSHAEEERDDLQRVVAELQEVTRDH